MSASFGKSAVPVLEGTPTELVVVSPPHDAGTVDVLVTAAGKQSATNGADRFTYNGAAAHRRHHRRHRDRRRRSGITANRWALATALGRGNRVPADERQGRSTTS